MVSGAIKKRRSWQNIRSQSGTKRKQQPCHNMFHLHSAREDFRSTSPGFLEWVLRDFDKGRETRKEHKILI
jgi:hypothetical protein